MANLELYTQANLKRKGENKSLNKYIQRVTKVPPKTYILQKEKTIKSVILNIYQ